MLNIFMLCHTTNTKSKDFNTLLIHVYFFSERLLLPVMIIMRLCKLPMRSTLECYRPPRINISQCYYENSKFLNKN